jgi:hypothetical protein
MNYFFSKTGGWIICNFKGYQIQFWYDVSGIFKNNLYEISLKKYNYRPEQSWKTASGKRGWCGSSTHDNIISLQIGGFGRRIFRINYGR